MLVLVFGVGFGLYKHFNELLFILFSGFWFEIILKPKWKTKNRNNNSFLYKIFSNPEK